MLVEEVRAHVHFGAETEIIRDNAATCLPLIGLDVPLLTSLERSLRLVGLPFKHQKTVHEAEGEEAGADGVHGRHGPVQHRGEQVRTCVGQPITIKTKQNKMSRSLFVPTYRPSEMPAGMATM